MRLEEVLMKQIVNDPSLANVPRPIVEAVAKVTSMKFEEATGLFDNFLTAQELVGDRWVGCECCDAPVLPGEEFVVCGQCQKKQ